MNRLFCVLLCLLIGVFTAVEPSPAGEVIGLQNIPLKPDELVWAFEIHLQEGRIIAVCNVPEGWTITAENYGEAALYKDGGGEVRGEADFGHDTLSATTLSELGAFLLIDRSTIHQKSATLTGSITVYAPSDTVKLELKSQNCSRSKADGCPVPPSTSRRESREQGNR